MATFSEHTIDERQIPFGTRAWVRRYVWQLPIRIFHWVFGASIVTLFATGLWIAWPPITTTGESYGVFLMGRVRQVHFTAAHIFLVIFLWRIVWFWIGNQFSRSGFPYVWRKSWWKDLKVQSTESLKLHSGKPMLGHNALAGLSYTIFAIGLSWAQIFTGFALYSESNPGGFWDKLTGWVIPLFGGSFETPMWHHLFAWGFVWFAILHIYIVLVDAHAYQNGLINSMFSGEKYIREERKDEDEPRLW